MLEYREFSAPEGSPLQCVWELRGEASEQQRIPPDGRCELIVHLQQPFEALSPAGWKRQSATLIAGQMTSPLLVRAAGSTHSVGVRFKSWASAYLGNRPASELTNQIAEGTEVNPGLAVEFWDIANRFPSDLEKLAGHIMMKFAATWTADLRVTACVHMIEQRSGQCRIEELATLTGLSFKQLERLFHQHVGVGPKTLARIRRFSHVFAQLEALQGNWAQIAYECGYTDQSHLARDFAQFTGVPPAALLSANSDLAWCFTAAHEE